MNKTSTHTNQNDMFLDPSLLLEEAEKIAISKTVPAIEAIISKAILEKRASVKGQESTNNENLYVLTNESLEILGELSGEAKIVKREDKKNFYTKKFNNLNETFEYLKETINKASYRDLTEFNQNFYSFSENFDRDLVGVNENWAIDISNKLNRIKSEIITMAKKKALREANVSLSFDIPGMSPEEGKAMADRFKSASLTADSVEGADDMGGSDDLGAELPSDDMGGDDFGGDPSLDADSGAGDLPAPPSDGDDEMPELPSDDEDDEPMDFPQDDEDEEAPKQEAYFEVVDDDDEDEVNESEDEDDCNEAADDDLDEKEDCDEDDDKKKLQERKFTFGKKESTRSILEKVDQILGTKSSKTRVVESRSVNETTNKLLVENKRLKSQLTESNLELQKSAGLLERATLDRAKLFYKAALLEKFNLNTEQKKVISESMLKTRNVKQAKFVYQTMVEAITNARKLSEGRNVAGGTRATPKAGMITESARPSSNGKTNGSSKLSTLTESARKEISKMHDLAGIN